MSVQDALGLDHEGLDRIIGEQWPSWSREHDALPNRIESIGDLAKWLRTQPPAQADAVLRALAKRAHVDHSNDGDAATVLAWVMMPAANRIAEQLRGYDPQKIDQHVAAHLWIKTRTTPWQSRGRIAVWVRWHVWRAVTDELSLPDLEKRLLRSSFSTELSVAHNPCSAEDELLALIAEARRCGQLSSDDVALLGDVLHASSLFAPGSARGAALLGERVSQAVAPLQGTTSRTVRRKTRSCIDVLRRLASA